METVFVVIALTYPAPLREAVFWRDDRRAASERKAKARRRQRTVDKSSELADFFSLPPLISSIFFYVSLPPVFPLFCLSLPSLIPPIFFFFALSLEMAAGSWNGAMWWWKAAAHQVREQKVRGWILLLPWQDTEYIWIPTRSSPRPTNLHTHTHTVQSVRMLSWLFRFKLTNLKIQYSLSQETIDKNLTSYLRGEFLTMWRFRIHQWVKYAACSLGTFLIDADEALFLFLFRFAWFWPFYSSPSVWFLFHISQRGIESFCFWDNWRGRDLALEPRKPYGLIKTMVKPAAF